MTPSPQAHSGIDERQTMTLPPLRDTVADHVTWLLSAGKGGARADLSARNLDRSYLHGHTLEGACFAGASLREAEMIRCEAARADFSDADLTGAFLHRANLSGASFKGAKLANAEFNHADLRDADFSGADLTGADFHKARIDGAVFTGAVLDGARGLPAGAR